MPARTVKIRHDENTRQKIKTSQIVNRLTGHVLGTVEMVPSQVTAALGLLRKTLPDLTAVQLTGSINSTVHILDGMAADQAASLYLSMLNDTGMLALAAPDDHVPDASELN